MELDPEEIAKWLKLASELGTMILQVKNAINIKRHHKDPFLIYDVEWLLSKYKNEQPVNLDTPYREIVNFLGRSPRSIQVNVIRGNFKLSPGNSTWASISEAGVKALYESKRFEMREPLIRLNSISRDRNNVILNVQKATYFDQAKSNLILDWPAQVLPPQTSLRDLLSSDYDGSLPTLDETRMANTIGVACILFYLERSKFVPYLVKRVEKVGVYPGGLHCTASGAANWPETRDKSFEGFIKIAMYKELEEEVGLKHWDVPELKEMAICREFLRGGKPQIFFAGFTNLSRKQLRQRRIKAAETIKMTGGWTEVEYDTWLKSSDVIIPPSKLREKVDEEGLTLECIAAYYYGLKYLEEEGRKFIS